MTIGFSFKVVLSRRFTKYILNKKKVQLFGSYNRGTAPTEILNFHITPTYAKSGMRTLRYTSGHAVGSRTHKQTHHIFNSQITCRAS